tara:strand:+ start:4234 stop:4671 length:438 start_codon:yes stop_codon:yes gene_type:complete
MNNNIIEANAEDSYSSILKKILSQNTLEKKVGVYLLFEYTRPHIVHSELFLEYLRIWDKELYNFLIKHHYRFKKQSLKESILDYSILMLVYSKKIFVYTFYILISILIIVIGSSTSLLIAIKLMEFIVKLLNGNLDNFHIFESPI